MSMQQRGGVYIPTCDCCGAILCGAPDYWDAQRERAEAGWQHFREDGKWVDLCPECTGEW